MVGDIDEKYRGATFGNRYDGKYQIKNVGSETGSVILKKFKGFLNERDVKIIFLVAEETNG